MKSGISLVEMAKEIQRQAELKADYMMDTRSLRLEPFGSDLYLNAYTPSGEMAVEPLEINAIAHRQIGTHLKIPAAYYDKMLTQHGRAAWYGTACGRVYWVNQKRCGSGEQHYLRES